MILIWGGCSYNGMVSLDTKVEESWDNVETQYQRRLDLIGNLVETVKGYADYEQETMIAVIEARQQEVADVKLDPSTATPEQIEQFQQAWAGMNREMTSFLNLTVERYPDLKANQSFLDLQRQLEGTENRISTARTRYNESIRSYNTKVRSFPTMLYAGMMGFSEREGFSADPEASQAPKVEF